MLQLLMNHQETGLRLIAYLFLQPLEIFILAQKLIVLLGFFTVKARDAEGIGKKCVKC